MIIFIQSCTNRSGRFTPLDARLRLGLVWLFFLTILESGLLAHGQHLGWDQYVRYVQIPQTFLISRTEQYTFQKLALRRAIPGATATVTWVMGVPASSATKQSFDAGLAKRCVPFEAIFEHSGSDLNPEPVDQDLLPHWVCGELTARYLRHLFVCFPRLRAEPESSRAHLIHVSA